MMDAFPEARWLAERSSVAGCIILVRRGWQQRGTVYSLYRLRLAVGGDAVICFCMPSQTEEQAYSGGGGGEEEVDANGEEL